jgi:hypothetical protein
MGLCAKVKIREFFSRFYPAAPITRDCHLLALDGCDTGNEMAGDIAGMAVPKKQK